MLPDTLFEETVHCIVCALPMVDALDVFRIVLPLRRSNDARSILNELLQYQIDADITKSLETIVANIDEVMKA